MTTPCISLREDSSNSLWCPSHIADENITNNNISEEYMKYENINDRNNIHEPITNEIITYKNIKDEMIIGEC